MRDSAVLTGLQQALKAFCAENHFRGKGPLCVALVVTNQAREKRLPLDPASLVTAGGGQVLGLGKGAVQAILKRHGIERVLAAESGRTSRCSLGNMKKYVAFLNQAHQAGTVDLDEVEAYWIQGVRDFFAAAPFKITMDPSRSLRFVVRDIVEQAVAREKEVSGTYYAGAVLQHLVGAKLKCALETDQFRPSRSAQIEHKSFSAADAPTGRIGDFSIDDVAIHVTTAPGEAVIWRCQDNLNEGYRPILVTLAKCVAVAEGLADQKELAERIDVFEVEQFIALNIYELSRFTATGRSEAIRRLVDAYNAIIDAAETDPSLRIELR